jgi:hypothetical protein
MCCGELNESVSFAFIEDPVIVPAIERIPKRSGTGLTLIGSFPAAPATMSWPRGAGARAAELWRSARQMHGLRPTRRLFCDKPLRTPGLNASAHYSSICLIAA